MQAYMKPLGPDPCPECTNEGRSRKATHRVYNDRGETVGDRCWAHGRDIVVRINDRARAVGRTAQQETT